MRRGENPVRDIFSLEGANRCECPDNIHCADPTRQ
jgi:hypothetical protein